MADPLATLARLRDLQTRQARSILADALAQEAQGQDRIAQAQAQRLREASSAPMDAADPLGRAFAAWLPASTQALEAARAELPRLQTASRQAADTLAACRAAAKAVETIAEERAHQARRRAGRKMQLKLDELGSRAK